MMNSSSFELAGGDGVKEGRSTLEKILLGLLFLNVGVLIILAVFLGTKGDSVECTLPASFLPGQLGGVTVPPVTAAPSSAPAGQDDSGVCSSSHCVTAASNLILSLDTTVEPCDDFYKFACGGWMDRHEIPESKSRYSTFTMMRMDVDFALKTLLNAPIAATDKDYVKKVKNMFRSCMDQETINAQGTQTVKDFIDTLGGWPLTSASWSSANFNLQAALLKANIYNLLPIFELYIGTSLVDPTRTQLQLDQPSFGLPRKYYLGGEDNKKFIKAYTDLMYGVGNLVGFVDPSSAQADVQAIIDFETRLANFSDSAEYRRDPYVMNNPMTLKDIKGNYSIPGLDISQYLLDMFALPGINITNINDTEVIVNLAPNYFDKLLDLLQNTPNKTLANYIVWSSLFDNIGVFSSDFRDLYINYKKVMFGTKSDSPRGDLCVGYVNRNLGFAAGKMFLEAKFAANSRDIANTMIDNIQAAFNEEVVGLDWMDEETKAAAKLKNDYISRRIGYPDSALNDTYLSDMYLNADISESNTFLQNILNCKHKFFVDDNLGFNQLIDKTRWSDPPQTVNAFYNPNTNQITFPAGILQPPFFNYRFPNYLNYGAMGSVIGHEITHGFDDQGRQYDKDGKLRDWWTNATSSAFVTQASCIVDQYDNFCHIGHDGKNYCLNGKTELGENLADNGGVKISYHAYRKWASTQEKPEPKLPGLDYTGEQLFFINFAQAHCGLASDEQIINLILSDPHAPGEFRAEGSLQNMAEFSQAFQCAAGSHMNPDQKCNVW